MAKRIAGILFDLGDTLLRFGAVDVRALFKLGARQAYAYLQEKGKRLPPFRRYHRRHLWSIWWNNLLCRLTGREFNSGELMARHCRRLHLQLTEQDIHRLVQLWYEPLGSLAWVEEGTLEALERLRDAGLKLGVVSNTFFPGAVLDEQLAHEGMLELLPVRVYSSDIGYRKPGEKIFQHALKRMGLAAGETLFVGDTPPADVVGANRAGLVSVLIDPEEDYPNGSVRAVYRIRAIPELLDIVAEHNAKAQDRDSSRAG